jgi:hypothetical protein
MHKIFGKYKMYFQPLHMFWQVNCHIQGVFIRELQVPFTSKYTICGLTVKVFYACHNSRCVGAQDYKLKTIIRYVSSSTCSYK